MNCYENRYELQPKFDSRKSFYGRAIVEISGGWGQNVTLYSYNTPVAMIGYATDDNGNEEFVCYLTIDWDHSATTLRHVKEFLRQYGFGAWTAKEIRSEWEQVDDYLMMVRP